MAIDSHLVLMYPNTDPGATVHKPIQELLSRSKPQSKPNFSSRSIDSPLLPAVSAHPVSSPITLGPFRSHLSRPAVLLNNVYESCDGVCFAPNELLGIEVFADSGRKLGWRPPWSKVC